MPRPKRPSDEAYNERRRQRRAAERAARARGQQAKTPSSDEAYNARRRYTRQAQRYLKKADAAYGAARERYTELAKQSAEKALKTYEKAPRFQDLNKGLKEAAIRTNANIGELSDVQRAKLISRSERALEGNVRNRREYEGRAIMSSSVGSRIIAAFEPIWRDYATIGENGKTQVDWEAASKAIFAYMSEQVGYEITDWLGVIEAFENREEVGAGMYDAPGNEFRYDAVVQAAQLAFGL